MAINTRAFVFAACFVATFSLFSCEDAEDPGPLQESEENYAVVDFDRLEMGDALIIDIKQGDFFGILARGDRRNIEDLEVYKMAAPW